MNALQASWIEPVGLTLVHFLWQGAVIGLVYAIGLTAARNASAATRYAIATATLVVLALAPLVTLAVLLREPITAGASSNAATSMFIQVGGSGLASEGGSWASWIVLAWLAGVVALSARLLLGWFRLWQLRRSADHGAALTLKPQLTALIRRLDIRRPVALAVSHAISSPVVIGWLKPLILLPPAIVAGLPTRQIEMILAHELAHVRRFDHLVNLLQTVVETILFYHPVVRWVSRRIRIERENACDDLAVAITADRLSYVEMLATLEKMRFEGPRLALGVNDGQVLSRIRRLVERSRPASQLGLTGPALLAVLIIAATASLQWVDGPESESEPGPAPVVSAPAADTAEPNLAAVAESTPDAPAAEVAADEAPLPTEPVTPITTADTETVAIENEPRGAETASQADSTQPPPMPSMPRDRLPPVESLIDATGDRQLALLGRPALTTPQLPEPRPEHRVEPDPVALTGGNIIERIEPQYPERALRRGVDGMVEVTFLVTRDGSVRDIRVIEETPREMDFGRSARQALATWRFEPFSQDGEAIERRVRLEVAFDVAQARRSECRDILGSRIPRCY